MIEFFCKNAVSIAALVVAFIAWITAKRIMVNQIYSGLVAEYRTPEMGGAILALFHFYNRCTSNNLEINAEYERLYNDQIRKLIAEGQAIDYSNALHFQRRQVAQFYTDMALLRDKCCCVRLSNKTLKNWFTSSELDLLKIILLLEKPASNVFIRVSVPEPKSSCVPMYQSILRLYYTVRRLAIK